MTDEMWHRRKTDAQWMQCRVWCNWCVVLAGWYGDVMPLVGEVLREQSTNFPSPGAIRHGRSLCQKLNTVNVCRVNVFTETHIHSIE